MLYHGRFTSGNKCPALVRDADDAGGSACGGGGGIWEISVAPSPQLCCEPKTALEKSVKEKAL